MDCTMPGLPVHHQLLEFTQTHILWVGDAIQPSYPLLSPSSPAFNLYQHQGLCKWVSSSHQMAKVLNFSFSFSPSNEYSGLLSFRMDWLDLSAVQGTLKVYTSTTNDKEAEFEWFYDNLQDLLELTPKKKKCPFHHRGLESKSRKARDTWSNRQVGPWCTKWSMAKTNRFCQENALVIANTLFQQHKRWLYTWTSPDGQYQNQTDCILCSWKWSSIQWANTRPGADCGSYHDSLLPNSDLIE